jgi:predicted NBD/HSP70 family sugar kinase
MAVIGIDIGGTKISAGLYEEGQPVVMGSVLLGGAEGDEVLHIIEDLIDTLLADAGEEVRLLEWPCRESGMKRPEPFGHQMYPGWIDYPLRERLLQHFSHLSFYITSDRACYIMGKYGREMHKVAAMPFLWLQEPGLQLAL